MMPHRLKKLSSILLLAIAYYGLAEISRQLASTPQDVTPVWPPDGLAVGAVLIWGNWLGYGVFLGSFLANVWAFSDPTTIFSFFLSTLPVLGIALGTTCGTLLGVFLLKRFTSNAYPLSRVTTVFEFLLFTGMIGPSINATMGGVCLALNGTIPWSAYGNVWLTWWISNVSGIFIVTPILLSWQYLIRQQSNSLLTEQKSQSASVPVFLYQSVRNLKSQIILESIVFLGIIICISYLIFNSDYHIEYTFIPILLWSAFRLGQPGVTGFNFIIATVSIIATVNGKGAFWSENLNQSLIQLQCFIGVITCTALLLSATIFERVKAEKKRRATVAELAHVNATLEDRVQHRTEELYEKNEALKQTLKDLKKTQLQMLQSEKMAALGQMVAGIAHEINNPVSFIQGNLEPASEYVHDVLSLLALYQSSYPHPNVDIQTKIEQVDLPFLQRDFPQLIGSMRDGTVRIKRIIESLRNFSRLDESAIKKVDLHEGLESTLNLISGRLKAHDTYAEIQVLCDYGELPSVECHAGQINQVFMNIIGNAIDAIRTNPENLHPQIQIITKALDAHLVTIDIVDNGPGIPPEIQHRLFEPFFTTKDIGKGTGLGLSSSYQIVTENHGGTLVCRSTLEQGTQFTIQLPIQSPLS